MATKRARRAVKRNKVLAWCWFAFGVLGLLQFVWWVLTEPGALEKTLTTPIAASIPVLFAISVYANFVGHLSAAESAED